MDAQLLNAWLTVMKAAHSSFSDELCLELLPKLFCCYVDYFMADKAFVKKTSSEMMQVNFESLMCLDKNIYCRGGSIYQGIHFDRVHTLSLITPGSNQMVSRNCHYVAEFCYSTV